jgi:hypothetical protein
MRRERARVFRSGHGDVAYCARCNAAWDIAGEGDRTDTASKPQPTLR